MIYKVDNIITEKLLKLPETGMGYQIIQGLVFEYNSDLPSLLRRSDRKFIVYNGELVLDFDESFNHFSERMAINGYLKSLREAPFIIFIDFYLDDVFLKNNNLRKIGGAEDNKAIKSDGKQIFVRLSAYSNDRRIDFEKRCLKEGSFTTTEEDYLSCKYTKDDPRERYALPNEEEIKWAFYIHPLIIDEFRPGIVQPAYGHRGGGIEAKFDHGTSNNTFFKQTNY